MTVPFICVFIAFLFIYLSKIPLGIAMGKLPGGYDNHNPRDQMAKLTGWGRRAFGLHQNTIEAFPTFAAAVIIAHLAGANPTISSYLAIAFLVARVLFGVLYLADKASLRSTVWMLGIFCVAGLFILPWIKK